MAYHGPPPGGMRPGPPGMMPPPGMFPPPHPSYGPPPMMMVPQSAPQGILPPGMHPMPVPPPGMPPPMLLIPRSHTAEPLIKVPIPSSTAHMKIATTVFVGNISEKASDTLIRQILLRCGAIDGWKRVQDATGKLQGFGFCEYADPDATLRALRLLHDLKLGEKALVAKVDAKTRKELLKYLITKKHSKIKGVVDEKEVDAEVEKLEEDKDVATAALINEVPVEAKAQDEQTRDTIRNLLKDYLSILSSTKSNEDIQRERDVKESILFMAKQSGKLDPDSTLEDMDMEDDVKTLVSDEIKRFRESYKRSDEARKEKKTRDKDRDKRERGEEDRAKVTKESNGGTESPRAKERSKRERSRSPIKRGTSPSRRQRSPLRSRSQERQEKEKRKEAMRQKEREDMMREEEEQEERVRQRRAREREKAFKQRLANWEAREYRKEKEYDKDTKREKERREEMEREKKHLGDFLAEYDDSKDDQKYYKGSAYNRRRREREVEVENDDRDRLREKDELEELRLQVIERQAREILSGDAGRGSSEEESPAREEEEEEDMDVPVKEELEEDIPLTKSGYTVPPAYPPIQVQSAPSVTTPTEGSASGGPATYRPIISAEQSPLSQLRSKSNDIKQEASEGNSPASYNSPTQSKLAFGLAKKTSTSAQSQPSLPGSSKLDKVFSVDEEDLEKKPKKKLVPIDYSDEEEEEPVSSRERDSGDGKKRSRRSSGKVSSRRSSNQQSDVGMVTHRSSSLSSAELLEEMKDRKLTGEDRKKMIQMLVNNIPTSKEEVFEYALKWDQIDESLIEKRVGPWINKKITEYIGEAEPILKDFICNKLSCHISPEDILNDISMVLDDEAEVFIVKLWRLLIYETEAKHLGIAKSY